MSFSSSRFALTCLLTTLLAASALVAAQGEWIESGYIAATIDGVEQTTHSYDIVVTDEDGTREAPGASFALVEEMKMGDMVLVEASYIVTILTYDRELENAHHGSIWPPCRGCCRLYSRCSASCATAASAARLVTFSLP